MQFTSAIMFKLFFLAAFFAVAMALPYGSPNQGPPSSNKNPPSSPPTNKSPPSSPFHPLPPPPPAPVHKPAPSKVFTTSAKPTPTKAPAQCNTGPIQCCESVQEAKGMSSLLDILGVAVDDLSTSVGMNCSPITAAGLSAGECNASPVCCENNSFGGIVSVGCSPINI